MHFLHEEKNDSSVYINANEESAGEKIVLHVYDDESKEFSSLTTYHGMIRIYTSQTWPSRIFWGVVVITCLTLFMIQGGVLLEFYNSHPTAMKIVENPLFLTSLPSVSFCLYSFKEKGFYLIEDHRQNIYNCSNYEHQSNRQHYFKTNFPCQDIFESYVTIHKQKKHVCDRMQTFISSFGVCFTFNEWNYVLGSSTPSLTVKLKKAFQHTLITHIHSSSDDPSYLSNLMLLETGQNSRISFKIEQKNLLPTNDWKTCKKKEETPSRKPYNYLSCLNQCYLSGFTCRPRNSTIRQIARKPKQCNCPVQCLVLHHVSQQETALTNSRRDTRVSFQISSMQLKNHLQYKRFKQIDLMSYIGGVMGLFLGMSCITLLEVFVYLFKTVFGAMNNTRYKEFFETPLSRNEKNRRSHEEITIMQKMENFDEANFITSELNKNSDASGIVHMGKPMVSPSHHMSVKFQLHRSKQLLKRNSVYLGNCDF